MKAQVVWEVEDDDVEWWSDEELEKAIEWVFERLPSEPFLQMREGLFMIGFIL